MQILLIKQPYPHRFLLLFDSIKADYVGSKVVKIERLSGYYKGDILASK